MKSKKEEEKKKKDTRKDNLVDVAKFIINEFNGELMATEDKTTAFEGVLYDTDVLNISLSISGLKFAKEGMIKGKKVQYFIITATKDSGEVVRILTNHAYVETIAIHLRDKKTLLACQIKYNDKRKFYYLASPEA